MAELGKTRFHAGGTIDVVVDVDVVVVVYVVVVVDVVVPLEMQGPVSRPCVLSPLFPLGSL